MGHHATGTVFWGYDLGLLRNERYDWLGPDWLEEETRDPSVVIGEAFGVDPDDYAACWRSARAHPVQLGFYGHMDGETLYRVHVKASERQATYECVRLDDLAVDYSWRPDLDRFMQLLGLPVPDHEPGWFLTSDYG